MLIADPFCECLPCALSDVCFAERLPDSQFQGRPQLCPFVGGQLIERDALGNPQFLAANCTDQFLMPGTEAQFHVYARFVSGRVLVLADVPADAEVHTMP